MSYILDALKRADAERERGTIPGIHAQPAAAWSAPVAQTARAGRTRWFILGVAAVLSGFAVWRLWGGQPSQPVTVVQSNTAAPVILPRATPNQAPAELKAATTPDIRVDVTPRRPVAARPEPVAAQRKPTSPTVSAVAAVSAVVAVKAPTPVEARTSPENATVDDKIFALGELPEEIRRDLPALTISGAIHSENVANRFLIINGQIFHENETPMPGVVLQKIKLKSAVLSFKGYRYSITY